MGEGGRRLGEGMSLGREGGRQPFPTPKRGEWRSGDLAAGARLLNKETRQAGAHGIDRMIEDRMMFPSLQRNHSVLHYSVGLCLVFSLMVSWIPN